ncbi:hypothetical protein ES703_92298 [subsurface metagenome]
MRSFGREPMCGKRYLSNTSWARCSRYSLVCPIATLFPIKSSASSRVFTSTASCRFSNSSRMISWSSETASTISRSLSSPKARIKTTSGTCPGTAGNEARKRPSRFRSTTTSARKPRWVEKTFATAVPMRSSRSIKIEFDARSSWVTITRSEPLTMK